MEPIWYPEHRLEKEKVENVPVEEGPLFQASFSIRLSYEEQMAREALAVVLLHWHAGSFLGSASTVYYVHSWMPFKITVVSVEVCPWSGRTLDLLQRGLVCGIEASVSLTLILDTAVNFPASVSLLLNTDHSNYTIVSWELRYCYFDHYYFTLVLVPY